MGKKTIYAKVQVRTKNEKDILTNNNGNSQDRWVVMRTRGPEFNSWRRKEHFSLKLRQYPLWYPPTSDPVQTGVLEAERDKHGRSWNKMGAGWQKRKIKYFGFCYAPKSFFLQSCNKSSLRVVLLKIIEKYYWRLSPPDVTLLAYKRFLQVCCLLLQDWRVICVSKAARRK